MHTFIGTYMITKIDIKHKKIVEHNGQKITLIERPKGIGDSIEKFLHTGTLGKLVYKITGHDKPCGKCAERKAKLNKLMSYKNEVGNV